MRDLIRKPLTWAIGAIALILAAWWAYSALTRDARTEARLGRNQATAASQAGSEAVNTIGKAGEREAESADLTRSNEKAIRDAKGSDAQVAAPARDAGLQALCRRAAYRADPRCVRQ